MVAIDPDQQGDNSINYPVVKVMAARSHMHTRRLIPDATIIILAPKNKNMDEAWDSVADNFSSTFDFPSHPSTNFS